MIHNISMAIIRAYKKKKANQNWDLIKIPISSNNKTILKTRNNEQNR